MYTQCAVHIFMFSPQRYLESKFSQRTYHADPVLHTTKRDYKDPHPWHPFHCLCHGPSGKKKLLEAFRWTSSSTFGSQARKQKYEVSCTWTSSTFIKAWLLRLQPPSQDARNSLPKMTSDHQRESQSAQFAPIVRKWLDCSSAFVNMRASSSLPASWVRPAGICCRHIKSCLCHRRCASSHLCRCPIQSNEIQTSKELFAVCREHFLTSEAGRFWTTDLICSWLDVNLVNLRTCLAFHPWSCQEVSLCQAYIRLRPFLFFQSPLLLVLPYFSGTSSLRLFRVRASFPGGSGDPTVETYHAHSPSRSCRSSQLSACPCTTLTSLPRLALIELLQWRDLFMQFLAFPFSAPTKLS